jgi:prolyl-tRNA synthetase
MAKKQMNALSVTREENYSKWYLEIVKMAELAENSPVRGCMTIKPWGLGIWENIKTEFDKRFKEKGVQNAYFPLLIPLEYMQKEADHVEGFAMESAIVTHSRLEKDENGKLVPAGKLENPFLIRPTSEMVIGEAFSRWISSYRDLPLCINQWANVMRWEGRTRPFLRTSEFLWQEGHTCHQTAEEANDYSLQMLQVYTDVNRDLMAIPSIPGRKTESEKFPGADITYTFETMTQELKALQAGTSHFLGQNFSKSLGIKFQSEEGKEEYVWTTSWGVSTRQIGGLIATHSDDDGLVLPPRVAPSHIVIIPMLKNKEKAEDVLAYCEQLKKDLSEVAYYGRAVDVIIDKSDSNSRSWDWVRKGIPVRLEIGAKELEQNTVFMGRRDLSPKDKKAVDRNEFVSTIKATLDEMHNNLLAKAESLLNDNIKEIDTKEEFYEFFAKADEDSRAPGFALTHWNGDAELEAKIKEDLGVTTRCLPFTEEGKEGKCAFTGEPSKQRVLFARAY